MPEAAPRWLVAQKLLDSLGPAQRQWRESAEAVEQLPCSAVVQQVHFGQVAGAQGLCDRLAFFD